MRCVQVLTLGVVCLGLCGGCGAIRGLSGQAVDGAIDAADAKVGELVTRALMDRSPEFLDELTKEVEKRKSEGDSTPWISVVLSNILGLIFALLFGGTALKLRKMGPLKAVSEVLSRAIGRVSSKDATAAKKLKTEIEGVAGEHPDIPNGESVRDVMRKAGAMTDRTEGE